MGFFNKALSSVGIGSAKVDTIIQNPKLRAGDQLHGVVNMKGGKVEQKVDSIYLNLMTEYLREVDDRKVRESVQLEKFKIAAPFVIHPNENLQIPFTIVLPINTPLSMRQSKVWIQTGLDIAMAIDPTDRDYLEVNPHPYTEVVLSALTSVLGFQIKEVENEKAPYHIRRDPIVQEFEFRATTAFRGKLDELECIFSVYPEGIEIFMEIDRKARGLGGFLREATGTDEKNVKLSFNVQQLQQGPQYIAQELGNFIQRYC